MSFEFRMQTQVVFGSRKTVYSRIDARARVTSGRSLREAKGLMEKRFADQLSDHSVVIASPGGDVLKTKTRTEREKSGKDLGQRWDDQD